MIQLIRKYVLAGSEKNSAAPQIILVLCAYTVITSVYTQIFFGAQAAAIRFILGALIVAVFAVAERSPLSSTITAFLSPTLTAAVLIFGAFYFKGDGLLFIYVNCVALISLTYFSARGLAAYIMVVSAALVVLLFVFRVNLLGPEFSMVYNTISLIASMGLNALAYSFCMFCVKNLQALTEAKNEAYLAAKAKGDFLANMSHEIRTPLNAVIGLTEAELRRKLPDSNLENLRKIHSSGTLLLGIINDILDMSKIESGKFDLIPAEYVFADMICETANLNMVRIGTKPIEFSVSVEETIPCRLIGDELRIKQLLSNLLSNSFKYTREGNVELRVSWSSENGGARLFFAVEDTGMGIRDEDLKKLFSEYAQVNKKTNRGIEGTGLGLSICKGLTGLMGGNISAQSEYGRGSVFSVDIWQGIVDTTPVGAAVAAALKDFTYIPEQNEQGVEYIPMPYAKVLVVDDLEINLEVAACSMEPYGMQVDCVENGASAIQRVNDGGVEYDIIFMDHMMPGMDGIETTRAIRELGTEYARNVPVIALTANALSGNDKMFAENGFQGFLAKPIDPRKLDAVLRRWINKP
ncbi:MAG: ATP-binding protein [Clostridiales bacterium]|nr:ATP-binding protein [Clostridiales bacterium]